MTDRPIVISVGNSRKSMNWRRVETTITQLYDRLATPIRGVETLDEYMSMTKGEQDSLKDVGGFVGGSLKGQRRKGSDVTGRDVITLDMDDLPADGVSQLLEKVKALGCAYCIYSTRKHRPEAPRLRVLLPLDRTATPDEYEAAARKMGELLGMMWCDPTTFEPARMMYWASCCADSEYVYVRDDDLPLLSVDFVLTTMYADWQDYSQWPVHPRAKTAQRLAAKQGDPLLKEGVVGAFCRSYDIRAAIDKYLPGVYSECSDGRLTYTEGSTAGGAVLYDDDKFLYSHHATDPCSGMLVNSFDLVRLHLFDDKDLDAAPGTPTCKLPSYVAMLELANKDPEVNARLGEEIVLKAHAAFTPVDKDGQQVGPKDPSLSWKLKRTNKGKLEPTTENALTILLEDDTVKDRVGLNLFTNTVRVFSKLPWEDEKIKDDDSYQERSWSDADDSGLRLWMEHWGISNVGKVQDAFATMCVRHSYDPLVNYLNGLEWDGVERLDTLFIDYLGAEDTELTRAITRKAFAAAVARAYAPGTKYDQMVILSGPQGIGKSSILEKLSKGWFNDSITTFEGKSASELLSGAWLVEIAELEAFNGSDTSRIKQFISQTTDRFRAAYGRHVSELPRRCIFFGTTNSDEYLRDLTGNRRMWPIDVGRAARKKSVFDMTQEEIDQLWAEAAVRYHEGEQLYLDGELYQAMLKRQEEHMEESITRSSVLDFLNKEVPVEWLDWTTDQRRNWLNGTGTPYEGELRKRDRVCAKEVLLECLGTDARFIKRWDVTNVNAIIQSTGKWERPVGSRYCGKSYGKQKCWVKKNSS